MAAQMQRRGYLPDAHDTSKDRRTRELFGAAITVPAEWSLQQYVDDPRDQLSTNQCVGMALARALQARAAAEGAPIAWPASQGIYTYARLLQNEAEGNPPGTAIQDVGCSPSLAVAGMTRFGVPADAQWPFDPSTINRVPDDDEVRAGTIYRVQGYYRISSDGPQRLADIRQAISHNYPVAVGVQIDKAFEDYSGGVLAASDPANLVGGHMTCLLAYESTGDFLGINSWGKSWGLLGSLSGWYRAGGGWLLSPYVGDIIVVTGELVPSGEVAA